MVEIQGPIFPGSMWSKKLKVKNVICYHEHFKTSLSALTFFFQCYVLHSHKTPHHSLLVVDGTCF